MKREDVIRLMLEAEPEMIINIKDHEEGMEGFTGEDPKLHQFWPFKVYVKFAALVAAHEREACAKLCDQEVGELAYGNDDWYTAKTLAAIIRARGET